MAHSAYEDALKRISDNIDETDKLLREAKSAGSGDVWFAMAATAGIIALIMTILDRILA
jgi:hypothetical protein